MVGWSVGRWVSGRLVGGLVVGGFNKTLLHVGIMLLLYYVHHPIPNRGNREHPGNFQIKLVSCSGIFPSWQNFF